MGLQWLVIFGPILWDFTDLTMKFTWRNKEVLWKGQMNGKVIIISKRQAARVLGSNLNGAYAMLLIGGNQEPSTITSASASGNSKVQLLADLLQLLT